MPGHFLGNVVCGANVGELRPRHLMNRSGRCLCLGAQGDSISHLVEPAAHGLPFANRARFAHQQEERGLEGIFGDMRIAQHPPAHAPDHGTVPPHQYFKGRLLTLIHETLQQLRIGERTGSGRLAEAAQVADHCS